MMPCDYAFMKPYDYNVNHGIYDEHRFYEYNDFRNVRSLLELLRRMEEFNDPAPEVVWEVVARNNSRPTIRIEARNYEEPYDRAMVNFLVDTGADVSMLTGDTADKLRIDRYPGDDDLLTVKGVEGKGVLALRRWIYAFFGGKLHPIPILVPPMNNHQNEASGIPFPQDILGRAAITSCFLLCFDNKRLYTFARRASEPSNVVSFRRA